MIESTTSEATWEGWCREAGVDDVYWSWPHMELWAAEWRAEAVGVRWSDGPRTVLHPVVRCNLGRIAGGAGRCDVRTAYDFGGPLWGGSEEPEGEAFERAWDDMLREWGAVTELLRLHPFRRIARPSYAKLHFHNYVVDLDRGYEAARASYHGSWRRDLAKAEGQRLESVVSARAGEREVADFVRLYRLTMERVDAPPWYRFTERTIAGLFALDGVRMVTVRGPSGDPAATGCLLRSGAQLFYHLSASDPESDALHPTHLMLDAMVRTGCSEGADRLHLGGGAPSLRWFKSRLAGGTVPYYVVKRVLDEKAYSAICEACGVAPDGEAFPAWLAEWHAASRGEA